jgi:hypothetical protein
MGAMVEEAVFLQVKAVLERDESFIRKIIDGNRALTARRL